MRQRCGPRPSAGSIAGRDYAMEAICPMPNGTIFAPFLPAEAKCGRKRAYPMREVVNAMCHVLRGGIAWRLMPDRFPPRRTVYRWFADCATTTHGGPSIITSSCGIASGSGAKPARRLPSWMARVSRRPRLVAFGSTMTARRSRGARVTRWTLTAGRSSFRCTRPAFRIAAAPVPCCGHHVRVDRLCC